MKRVSYNMVEREAVLQARKGHHIRLKLRYTGMLEVIHDGKIVLTDGPKDYSVALAKVRSIGMSAEPTLPPSDAVTDKDVSGAAIGKTAKKRRAKGRAEGASVKRVSKKK